MIDFQTSLIFFVGVPFLFVCYWVYYSRRRGCELRKVAAKLNFSFSWKGKGQIARIFSDIRLFRVGKRSRELHIMRRADEELKTFILDVAWFGTKSKAKRLRSARYIETLICFESSELNLPDFAMRPGGQLMRFNQKAEAVSSEKYAGYDRMTEYEPFSDFSRLYVLYGKDKQAVAHLFRHSQVDAVCSREEGIGMEGNGNHLVVYKWRRSMHPEELEFFYSTALRIYMRFTKGARLKNTDSGDGETLT